MAEKTIPCRVCGKQFKPCGFCQSHSDTFRWRNFACSKECAQKYIADTIAYREMKKQENNQPKTIEEPTVSIISEESNIIDGIVKEVTNKDEEGQVINVVSQKKKKKNFKFNYSATE